MGYDYENAVHHDGGHDYEYASSEEQFLSARDRERAKLAEWRGNIRNQACLNYLKKRGITEQKAIEWGLGYDALRKRLVIPFVDNDYYHVDRDITDTAEEKYTLPERHLLGRQPLYNLSALDEPAFYVVEGALDALAIIDAGRPAVALCGTGSRNLVGAVVAQDYQGVVISALDNDSEGQQAQDYLVNALKQADISVTTFSYHKGAKDASDARYIDPWQFQVDIDGAYEKALRKQREALFERYHESLEHLRVAEASDVLMGIFLKSNVIKPISTGFEKLDELLEGGLRPGLYALGGCTSSGKTSLSIQIADQIASLGRPVIYVSIVRSGQEIVSKSLARIIALSHPSSPDKHVTAREIVDSVMREAWTEEQDAILAEASQLYMDSIGTKLRIIEGRHCPTPDDIRSAAMFVRARFNGVTPVVFIDRLQLMRLKDESTPIQAPRRIVTALRQVARDLKTPVFVTASTDQLPTDPITLQSFSDSWAVASGADVVLGVQPRGLDALANESSAPEQLEELLKHERRYELLVLKNRHGKSFARKDSIPFIFNASHSLFSEDLD